MYFILIQARQYLDAFALTFLQSVFLEMFGELTTNPKAFNITDLGSVCSLIRDGTHKTPSYISSGIPFITVKNIVTGILDFTNTKFISQDEHLLLTKRVKPERDDILVSKDGSIGIPCLVDSDREFSIFVSVALLKPKHTIVNAKFLAQQILSEAVQKQIREGTKGIAIRHLHLEDFQKLKILLPPLPLQEKFAQIVQKFEHFRTQQREAERQAEHLFQTLLHRAFRGELTSSDFDDEAVSALSKEFDVKQSKPKSPVEVAEYLRTKVNQQETEAVQLTLPGLE